MLAYYCNAINKIKDDADFTNYYNNLPKITSTGHQNLSSACRVCLKEGQVSIYAQRNSKELIEALQLFGNIVITNENKLLCLVCLKFIKLAISFRKVALQSEEIFKSIDKDMKIKLELFETFDDDQHVSSNIVNKYQNIPSNEPNQIHSPNHCERKQTTAKVSCPICGKVLTKNALKQHLLLHDPNRKKYVCHVCGKTFGLPMSFRRHTMRHRTDFPYKCNLCPYRGQFPELLKSHMRSHTRDYRYMCTECPGRFIFISNLNSHMLKHKEPQYKCDTCKRGFHTKLTLERHIEYDHLGVKNHICNICNKAFGNRRARLQHERGVHKREKLNYRRMPSYLKAESMD